MGVNTMYAIIHATVQTLTNIEEPLKDHMIMIKDGKIASIEPMDEANIPEEAKIIDASGLLVTPGLIDVHTHIGIDEEGIAWEGADFNETSEAITPHVRAIDGINPFDQGFMDAAQSGVTTVQILPGSANVIGGLMTTLKVKPNRPIDEMVVSEISGLKIAFGENPKKYHGQHGRAPVTRMGVAALLREQFVKAANYIEKHKTDKGERNLRMEALAAAVKRQIPVRAHTHRADDILTAIRIANEFNLDLTIEHATEGHKIAPQIAKSGFKVAVGPTLSSRSKVELREISWDTYRMLAQHKIAFSMITDHPVLPIQHLTTSATMAVKAGLSLNEAWRSLTIHPAKHLGLEQKIGSLEPGKDADLVFWNQDPIKEGGEALLTIVDGDIIYKNQKLQHVL